MLLLKGSCVFEGHYSLLLEVCLVADQEGDGVGVALLFDLLQPVRQPFEGVSLRDRVSEYDCVSRAVEYLGDGSERFLSGCVPYLQFELCVTHFDHVGGEVNPDSHVVVRGELVRGESLEYARLANACPLNVGQLTAKEV